MFVYLLFFCSLHVSYARFDMFFFMRVCASARLSRFAVCGRMRIGFGGDALLRSLESRFSFIGEPLLFAKSASLVLSRAVFCELKCHFGVVWRALGERGMVLAAKSWCVSDD